MRAYNPRSTGAEKITGAVIAGLVLFFGIAAYAFAADESWSKGNRVHVVLGHGISTSIESGFITNVDGDVCRIKWDKCNCETLVPIDKLYRSLSQAHKAEALHRSNDVSIHEAAQSAGRIGLIYMLLSQRSGK